jgi:DNA (cytosine-5)-methyltransferase 1
MSSPSVSGSRSLRVVSVFSGVAGLDSGLEQAGHRVVEMCESWAPARRVLAEHYPEMAINEDVQTYTPRLPYDLLAAGFPCTDLSHAGGRAGIFGPSSGLVEHVFRIVFETQPQWVLLENVPNLLELHSGAGMDYVIGKFEDLGYKWAYRTLDARFTGVPQRRPRVIILATRDHDPAAVLLDEDAGAAQESEGTACGFYWTEGRNGLGLVAGAIPTLKGGSTLGLPSAPAVWFPERERGQRLVLPGIEDGEALQGFPRGWTSAAVVPGEPDLRWKLIGNAVPVGIGRWLGDRLADMPTSSSAAGETMVTAREIRRGRRWPKAGWGESGNGYAADVTEWPRRAAMTSLADILQTPTPLSHRATKGFLSRVEEAGRAIPEQLRRDIEEHMRQVRPVLSRPSWAASPDSRRRMQLQRQKNTKPELAIRRLLHKRGRRFRLQVRPSPKMRQRIDIAFLSEKVAVDVRGCFWHRCPDHGTAPTANAERWAEKLARNVARDVETEQTLTALGWLVIVVWEHEDPETAAARIDAAVLARRYAAQHQTTTQLKGAAG